VKISPRYFKVFVVIDNPGRLGNLMNRHGHLLAFAIDRGHVLIDVSFLNSSRYFPRLNTNLLQGFPRIPVAPIPLIVLRAGFWAFRRLHRAGALLGRLTADWIQCLDAPYPNAIDLESEAFESRIGKAGIVFLSGYIFEARSAFQRHAIQIRRQFAVSRETQTAERSLFRKLRSGASDVVGVHIRHTDFRTYCDGRWFYTAEQYAKVMKWHAECNLDRNVRFVICSDEPQRPESFAGLNCTFHAGDCASDLRALSLCDRIISTNSSFARAAAFLGKAPLLQIFDPDEPATHSFSKIEVLEEGWNWHSEKLKAAR
jgi:hypothetical protein